MAGTEDTRLPQEVTGHRTIAPAWHTVLLIVAIAAISIMGRAHVAGAHHAPNRLLTYGTTAGMELLLLGWVVLGLRLRRVSLRSLFGTVASGTRGLAVDFGVAAVFWIGTLTVLGMVAMFWTGAEAMIEQARHGSHPTQGVQVNPQSAETLRTLEQLAPANGGEAACWVLLCCLVGMIEELVFRGYLQMQFTAWARGRVVWGVVSSALLFGAGHGYQGTRNMVLLALFGALLSGLAIMRCNLRAGIIAHSWHDLVAGLTLAVLRSHHLV